MKDKKCDIKIEFQAESDWDLQYAAQLIYEAISKVTRERDVTATFDLPMRYLPH